MKNLITRALVIGGCLALSDEAPADLILTEVLYDVSGADDGFEWVEIFNTGGTAVDLANWSLSWAGVGYGASVLQLSGSIAPGQAFVVGGPDATADNGNPSYDQVVDFDPDIQNSGSDADAVALFNLPATSITPSSIPVDAVIYGETNTNGLIDETGEANAPDVGDVASGSIGRIDLEGGWRGQADPSPNVFVPALPGGRVILSEVLYDVAGSDTGLEWIELYNAGTAAVDLSGWSIGAGGPGSYPQFTFQLSGTIAPGQVYVLGGADSSATNYDPVFDLILPLSLQNSGSEADAIGLFDIPAVAITTASIPVDALIYGEDNTTPHVDENGNVGSPDIGAVDGGWSLERIDLAGTWRAQPAPTPNTTALVIPALASFSFLDLRIVSVGADVVLEIDSPTSQQVTIAFSTTLGSDSWIAAATVSAGEGTTPITIIFPAGSRPAAGFFLGLTVP